MTACAGCGTAIAADAKFCAVCGRPAAALIRVLNGGAPVAAAPAPGPTYVAPVAPAPAATAPTPAAPAPTPAPVAAAPARVAPTQAEAAAVVEQIKQIASLRDAGAITPEEFEAKKKELLSRI